MLHSVWVSSPRLSPLVQTQIVCVCVPNGLLQLSLIQAELESQCEAKCERALASAKEQHVRQCQELCEQRDSLQHQVAQLEEKVKGCSSLL